MKLLTTAAQVCAVMGAIAAFTATPAHAAEGLYGAVSGSVAMDGDINGLSVDEGNAFGVAVGAEWKALRIEANVDRVSHEINLGGAAADASAMVYGGSAFLDFPITEKLGLFAGGGGGYADAEASLFGTDLTGDGISWNVKAGAAFRLSDTLIGEAYIKHIEADLDMDVPGGGQFNVDYAANFAGVGLRLAL